MQIILKFSDANLATYRFFHNQVPYIGQALLKVRYLFKKRARLQ